jgi:glycosyltransferase involved in cell wall biosynthesis
VRWRYLELIKHYIGRTSFDETILRKHNSTAKYYYGYELLRETIYENEWSIDSINRHSIYFSSLNNPLKGFHTLLDAIKILIHKYPDIRIIVPGSKNLRKRNIIIGNSYWNILCRKISENGFEKYVEFSGFFDGCQIADHLRHCHVFVLSSLIENSSNALGEAQVVGTPTICTATGGTISIVEDEINGLFHQVNNPNDLAKKIDRLFSDDELAKSLSNYAKIKGRQMHNYDVALDQYSNIYKEIAKNESHIQ